MMIYFAVAVLVGFALWMRPAPDDQTRSRSARTVRRKR